MFKKLFGNKEKVEQLLAPINGQVINIEDVPDPVFSGKMMGDGIAILPEEGLVVSPIDAEVIQVFHTKHALGLRTKHGIELLIHIGLETVNLKGEGFEVHVTEGQRVKAGDKLVTFDIEFLKSKAPSIVTPIVVTNGDLVEKIEKTDSTQANIKETQIMSVYLK
ncbi:PTS glucose transporter subunit IIA [Peribacillus sp. NJ4]|jgi:PTS system glucose-specific IIA component|uniref:PTS sugar transporter subunit IIA n=1 Tax=unclassified Peribacillus TaxID=2675266 RepID=UPI0025A2FB14|nr:MULTISPECIES: PTS glucose transporter subunit IIA [unclassified Peribacillus]MDM5210973.1 PTS glucose transporter subunit IIA [Peribacillus sp. NJ4]MDM5221280.1 PTS glucose transporter subunit IIA [Peribacillus sp. NJ11]